MAKSYFSQYESPNILIVPTVSFHSNSPPPKKKKIEHSEITRVISGQSIEKCANAEETITNSLNMSNSIDINKNNILKEDLKKKLNKPNTSWASSYLQCIGQVHKKPIKVNSFPSKNKTMIPSKNTPVRNNDRTNLGTHHQPNESSKNVLPSNVNIPKNIIDLTKAEDNAIHNVGEDILNTVSSKNVKSCDMMTLSYRKEKINKSDNHQNKIKVSSKLNVNNPKPIQNTSHESKLKDTFNKDQRKILYTKESSKCVKDKSKIEVGDNKTKLTQGSDSRDSTIKKYKTEKDQKIKNFHSSAKKVNTNNEVLKTHLDSEMKNKLNNRNICKTKLNKCDTSNSTKEIDISVIKNLPEKHFNSKPRETNIHVKNISTIPTNSGQLNNLYEEESKITQDTPMKSVVQITEHFDLKKTQNTKMFTDNKFDLRSKLSRKNLTTSKEIHRKSYKHSKYQDGIPREKLDNLLITVEQNGEKVDAKSSVKNKAHRTKSKTKNCKKIKLVINVILQKRLDSSIESSSSDTDNSDSQGDSSAGKDLSFLDDFNVDEIVESLKNSQNETDVTQQKVNEQYVVTDHIHKSSTAERQRPVKNEIKIEDDKSIPNNRIVEKDIEKPVENGAIIFVDQRPCKIINNQGIKKEHDGRQVENVKISKNRQHLDVTVIEDDAQPLFYQHLHKLNNIVTKNTQKTTKHQKYKRQSEPLNDQDTKTVQQSLDYNIVTKDAEEPQPSNCQEVKNVKELNNTVIENAEVIIIEDDVEPEPSHNQETNTVQRTHNNIVSVNTEKYNSISNTQETKMDINDTQYKADVKEMSILQVTHVSNEVSENNENIDLILIHDEDQPESLKNQESKAVQGINDNITSENINLLNISNTKEGVNDLIQRNMARKKNQGVPINSNEKDNIQTTEVDDSKTIFMTEESIHMPSISHKMSQAEPIISTINLDDKIKVSDNIKIQVTSESAINVDQQSNVLDAKESKKYTLKGNKMTFECNIENPVESQDAIKEPAVTSTVNNSSAELVPQKEITFLLESDKIIAEKLEKRMSEYLHAQYTVTSLIRHGKFSKIYKCKDSSGENYAIKKLNNECDRYTLGIYKENILMQLQKDIPKDNLNCIRIINGFGLGRYWCFLMEYYPENLKQALKERNKPFHINEVQDLSRQLVSAVTILRNNYIVHSDIKPNHILLNATHNKLKLCGFDASYKNGWVSLVPNIGTVNYRAPEVILGYSAGYSIDVWSTALVMYEMATNTKLFPGIYNNDILFKQMCIFGNISYDMMQKSLFKENHFAGNVFMRRVGFKGQNTTLVYKFLKNNMLSSRILRHYNRFWGCVKTKPQRLQDLKKIDSFYQLLDGMLCIDPLRRLPIEFVCSNPFIYKKFT